MCTGPTSTKEDPDADRRRGDRGTAERLRSDEIGSSSPNSEADDDRRRLGGGAGTGARLSLSSGARGGRRSGN